VQARWEEGLWFCWRSWSWSSFSSWCWLLSSWCGRWGSTASICSASDIGAAATAAVNDFVATCFQSFFSLSANTTVTVSQSTGQSSYNAWAAAALVLADLVTNLVSSFLTNSFVSVVKTVDESVHNFWMAAAVVLASELVESSTAILSVAVCH